MADINLRGQAGSPTQIADGSTGPVRIGKLGDVKVSQLHGRYSEQAVRGNLHSLYLAAITTGVAAGNINGASAAASTQFALWNPAGSGVNVALLDLWINLISGTTPVAPMAHNWFTAPTVAETLTNGVKVAGMISRGASAIAKGFAVAAGATLTGGGALTAFRHIGLEFTAGTLASLAGVWGHEDIGGSIVIPPGFGWAPCFAASGTTLLFGASAAWEELPINV